MSFRDEEKQKNYLKNYHFITLQLKNPYIKRLNNIYILHELPIYDELSVARALEEPLEDSKDPSIQLTISKPSIKDFFC